MPKLQRPAYVLCHPGDTSGCGYHRVLRPLEILARSGVIAGRAELAFLPDHLVAAMKPDVIIWQRQSEDSQIEVMKRYRKILPEAFFVYELDDALSAVPDSSWHKPYMPSNVDHQTKKAVAVCDVVTVTTHGLAHRMREICGPETKVRVVPNMLGKDDLERVDGTRKMTPKVARTKLRVGWGGGIGHKGDLAILNKAFAELKDEVHWVFLGMCPDLPEGTSHEFRGATNPQNYLQALASLDIDLMVAPLEDNVFNNCKSNLRLIEGGACMYPTIASNVETYRENSPPVFSYCDDEQGWIDAIRSFAALGTKERMWEGERMRRWVERHYIMDDHAAKRAEAWLPDNTHAFVPKLHMGASTGKPIIVYDGPFVPDLKDYGTIVSSFERAAEVGSSADIVYIRNSVIVSKEQFERALASANKHHALMNEASTVSFFGNDSGLLGFPKQGQFMAIDGTAGTMLDSICESRTSDPVTLAASTGPFIVLKRRALEMLGFPDTSHYPMKDSPYPFNELAVIEWSVMAAARGFKNFGSDRVYFRVDSPSLYPQDIVNAQGMRLGLRWQQTKNDDEGVAKIRESIELEFYKRSYKFLPPQNFGDYDTWVNIIGTPGPRTLEAMEEWLATQEVSRKIQVVQYDPMQPLVLAGLYDTTEWIVFVQNTAKISPETIGVFTAAINDMPEAKVIYADHDYIDPQKNKRVGHDFKPQFDLHMFMGRDYVTPVFMIRREELSGGILAGLEAAGSALYAEIWHLLFRHGTEAVKRVPYILAHLMPPRMDDMAKLTKNKADIAEIGARNMGINVSIKPHDAGMGLMVASYKPEGDPLVSIIIPTKNKVEMLEPCLATILRMTTYKNFEVLLVDNGSTRKEMLDFQAKITDPRVTVVKWDHPYNWSKLNNWAAEQVHGDYLLFLNDDTRLLSPHWIEEMVGAAQASNVGVVGAKLVYPQGVIQHIGVVSHCGVNGHIHKGLTLHSPGYQGLALISHEATAVTGACMMVEAKFFDKMNGFDTSLANNFNDVDFCLQARLNFGKVSVVANNAELQHLEGVTRVTAATEEGKKILIEEGVELSRRYKNMPDPYFNPNLQISAVQDGLMIVGLNFDVLNWVRTNRPWFKKSEQQSRVLYVGDASMTLNEKRDDVAVYELAVVGYQAVVTNPIMEHVKPFDLRDPEEALRIVDALGISEILITSIRNMNLDILPFLTRLNRKVIYRPVDAEMACPQHDLKPKGKSCEKGWRSGGCQECIDRHGTPHGYVSRMAWIAQWIPFITHRDVTVDLSLLQSGEYSEVIKEVYNHGAEDVRAA